MYFGDKNRLKKFLGVFFAFFLATGNLYSVGLATESEGLVRELLEVAGVRKMADQIPVFIQMGIQEAQSQKKNLPEEDFMEFERLTLESFSGPTMNRKIQEGVKSGLDEEKLKKLLEWHKSPIVGRMIKLETENSSPEKLALLENFIRGLGQNPLPEKRVSLFRRLDSAIRGTENNVNLVVRAQFGMMRALNQLAPESVRQGEEVLKAAEEKALAEASQNMAQQTQGSYGFVYREATDAELEEYIGFYEKDPGREWASLISRVIADCIESSSSELGSRLGKRLKEKK